MKKDRLFDSSQLAPAGSFVFDQRVAEVFDDMVSRSVPGYSTIQLLVADLALTFTRDNAIYDLGCSTGSSMVSILERSDRPLKIVGVDNSHEMLEQCRARLAESGAKEPELLCLDFVTENPFQSGIADVVILNLSMQFVRPVHRSQLLDKCFKNTASGGCLILIEKTVEADKILNGFYVEYYHRFKREMGYSDLEISSKREALENVLIPFQREENISLLREAGYKHAASFFQWFNFSGFLAIKE